MRTATITTTSGHTWTTDINGTDSEICRYFLGEWFDVEPYPSERKERALFVNIDGKLYSVAWPGYAKEFRARCVPIAQTKTQSLNRWFLDVLTDGNVLETLRVTDTIDSATAAYRLFCPDQSVRLAVS